MAIVIVNERQRAPLPADAVLIWLTNSVEADYTVRGVFPALRRATAIVRRSNESLHVLTPEFARAVHEDAVRGELERARYARVAYRALVDRAEYALQEAEKRRSAIEGPPVLDRSGDSYELWRGSKEQLITKGVQLVGAWPQKPAGKWGACGKDWRGHPAKVIHESEFWPGLYEVKVDIPRAVKKPEEQCDQSAASAALLARAKLKDMPTSADDFRSSMARYLRKWLPQWMQICLRSYMEPSMDHGFILTDGSASELLSCVDAGIDAVIEMALLAEVKFDALRHSHAEQGFRATVAAADPEFISTLARIVQPNNWVVQGEAP